MHVNFILKKKQSVLYISMLNTFTVLFSALCLKKKIYEKIQMSNKF